MTLQLSTQPTHLFACACACRVQVLLNLLLLLLQMVFAKVVFYLRFACKDRGFSLDKALCDPRNNAVATSLAAYAFAQGLLLVGIALCPNENPGMHAADMLLWQTVGCALLLIAFKLNDVVLLFHINNTQVSRSAISACCY